MQLVLGQTYNNRTVTHISNTGSSGILQCNYCKTEVLLKSKVERMRACRYCNHVDEVYQRAIQRRSEWSLKDVEEFKKIYPPVIINPPFLSDLNMSVNSCESSNSFTFKPKTLSKIFVSIREELKSLNHDGINSFIDKSNFNVWEGKKLVTLNVPSYSPYFKGKNPSLSYHQEIWEPICKKYLGSEYIYSLYFY